MRFVTPETRRIDLAQGPKGESRWIEVKKELSKGEDAAFRARGFRRMSQGRGEQAEIDIDWTAMALARVQTYLVDWSAERDGKRVKVTHQAISELDNESFDELDEAIQKHIAEMAEEKKARSGQPELTATSI